MAILLYWWGNASHSFTLPDFSQALHSQHYNTESHDNQIHIAAELGWLCNVTAEAALDEACLLPGRYPCSVLHTACGAPVWSSGTVGYVTVARIKLQYNIRQTPHRLVRTWQSTKPPRVNLQSEHNQPTV